MKEPYLSRFRDLLQTGQTTQDIHDTVESVGYASAAPAVSDAYLERELSRVELHARSLCPLLEQFVGKADRILDVGCNTGGTTVALVQSEKLSASELVGVDPNHGAIRAAEIRARGYDLPPERVRFAPCEAVGSLPFAEGQFRLTVCVSVLEFISTGADRRRLVGELIRVTRPGIYFPRDAQRPAT